MSFTKKSGSTIFLAAILLACMGTISAMKLTKDTGPAQFEKWSKVEDYSSIDKALQQYLIKEGQYWAYECAKKMLHENLNPCALFHLLRNLVKRAKDSSVDPREVLELLTYKILVCMLTIADIKICVRNGLLYGPHSKDTTDRYQLLIDNLSYRFKPFENNLGISFEDAFTAAKKIFKNKFKLGSPAWICCVKNDSWASEWVSFHTPSNKLKEAFDMNEVEALRIDAGNNIFEKLKNLKTWDAFYKLKELDFKAPSLKGECENLKKEKKVLVEKYEGKIKDLNESLNQLSLNTYVENNLIKNFYNNEMLRLNTIHNHETELLKKQIKEQDKLFAKTLQELAEKKQTIEEFEKKLNDKCKQQAIKIKNHYYKKFKELGEKFSTDKKTLEQEKLNLQKLMEDDLKNYKAEEEAKDVIIKELRAALEREKKKKNKQSKN